MSTNTSLGLTTLLFVVGYLIVMYYGVRDAKSKKWSFGVEATIAVFTVLIFQWLFFAIGVGSYNRMVKKKGLPDWVYICSLEYQHSWLLCGN